MNKTFKILTLVLAALALVLAGCGPATPAAVNPVPQVQNQPQNQVIELKNPPTTAPEQAMAAAPAPAAASSASLQGLVWEDQDRDGIQDWKEPGVPNVTVNLLTRAGAAAGTTTTDHNGAYGFKDLQPGEYLASFQLPPGYVFSPQGMGINDLVNSDVDPTTAQTVPVPLAAGENGLVFTTGIYSPSVTPAPPGGTVKPPAPEFNVCVPGTYPLGGISTVRIGKLAPGYCLHAYLWNHGFAIGRIPGGAGRILSDVTFLEYFYQGNFVANAPSPENAVQVCYAVPAGTQAQIYFFDHFGPKFGNPHQGGPAWVPLETTIQNGIACAVAQTSGAYALIGK